MNSPKRQFGLTTLRVLLHGIFIAYPIVLLRDNILGISSSPTVSVGNFLLLTSLLLSVIAVVSLNYVFGYASFLFVLAAELLLNPPLVVFSTHITVALIFSEGISAIKPYHQVSLGIIPGNEENVTASLESCVRRFRRTLMIVAGVFILLSLAYGILPEILPLASGTAALALYATISIIAIALTVLYLGERE